MKKILSIIVLLVACCVGSKAQTYYIQGETTDISDNWTSVVAANRMSDYIEINSTRRYYIKKEITAATANTVIKFRVRRVAGGGKDANYITYNDVYPYNTDGNTSSQADAATLHFADAGTYKVMFTIDLDDDTSLEAVILEAYISKEKNDLWTQRSMTYDETDNKFHYTQDVVNIAAGTTAEFTALVYHRTTDPTTPVTYGATGAGDADPVSITFTEAGSYRLDFTVDPLWRDAPEVTAHGYYDFPMPTLGYATFSYHKVVDVPEGVTADFITGQNSSGFFATATNKIPATSTTPELGTGVILHGAPGTYRLYWSADQSAAIPNQGSNLLYGTGSATHTVSAGDTYVFANKDGNIGFYVGTAGTYEANKAFLDATDVHSVSKFLGIDFGNEETSISKVEAPQQDGIYYNLMGLPVPHPTKGLYILNGRKVMIK